MAVLLALASSVTSLIRWALLANVHLEVLKACVLKLNTLPAGKSPGNTSSTAAAEENVLFAYDPEARQFLPLVKN